MNVPPAATYLSRIANEVASSVAVPKYMAPRLSTLTSRRVLGAVPIVRDFMRNSSSSRPVRPGDEHESGCWSALQVNYAGPGGLLRLAPGMAGVREPSPEL